MASSVKETAQYFLTPSELAAKVEENPKFVKVGVKVGATVVNGTINRAPDGRSVAFSMTDSTTTYKVVYRGVIPDTFTDGVDVVVEGRLSSDGHLRGDHAARQVRVPLRERAGQVSTIAELRGGLHARRLSARRSPLLT